MTTTIPSDPATGWVAATAPTDAGGRLAHLARTGS